MLGNEGYDSSGFSESASSEALSSGRSVDTDPTLPPLGVKITGYRLLNMMTVFSFGSAKAILTYMGQSAAPTTLDWVAGTLLAVLLYWIGLYEQGNTKKWEWFFRVDLAPGIDHCTKRVVGGFLGTLFYIDFLFIAPPLIGLLGCLVVCLHDESPPLGSFGIAVSVYLLYFCVGVFTGLGRIQADNWGSHWQRLIRFVDNYGPMAPLVEEHEWSGEVGAIVGFFSMDPQVVTKPQDRLHSHMCRSTNPRL
ncbi:hypothetical protein EDB87DRAFT_1614773 [Lactarius vividus]|nr:hypothetical protein EDB87DRAFT_1614773 [Lactarius vividus]